MKHHTIKQKLAKVSSALTELEIAKIIAKLRQGMLSGIIDGEKSEGILFNLITTRKYD